MPVIGGKNRANCPALEAAGMPCPAKPKPKKQNGNGGNNRLKPTANGARKNRMY